MEKKSYHIIISHYIILDSAASSSVPSAEQSNKINKLGEYVVHEMLYIITILFVNEFNSPAHCKESYAD